jgi:hypothetical protein
VTTPRHFSDGDLVSADGNRTSTIIVAGSGWPEYAVLSRADPSDDRRKLSYTYRGGFDDPSTSAKDEDDVLVDLAAFDVETTVGILRGAAETVAGRNGITICWR